MIGVVSHGHENPVYQIPDICPACGSPVFLRETKRQNAVKTATALAQLFGNLIHFASRDAMDIEGLDPSIVENLVAAGLVKSPADLYDITLEEVSSLIVLPKKAVPICWRPLKIETERFVPFVVCIGNPGNWTEGG